MTFQEKLNNVVEKNNSLLCIGLDSAVEKLPDHLNGDQFAFNKEIIDATHDLVCAYKPNTAFYDQHGTGGLDNLKNTIEYIREKHPDIPVILDAKRGDIGNTNRAYAGYAFDWLKTDAMTIHPYLGKEAAQPFLDRTDKAVFVLCRTSNPGAGEFQDLLVSKSQSAGEAGKTESKPLYQIVAKNVSENWNTNNNCGLIVGATCPEELAKVRKIVGNDMPLLVPGIGKQGGDVGKTVQAGLGSNGAGMLINSSRGIIFAGDGKDFAEKAQEKAGNLRDQINQYRTS